LLKRGPAPFCVGRANFLGEKFQCRLLSPNNIHRVSFQLLLVFAFEFFCFCLTIIVNSIEGSYLTFFGFTTCALTAKYCPWNRIVGTLLTTCCSVAIKISWSTIVFFSLSGNKCNIKRSIWQLIKANWHRDLQDKKEKTSYSLVFWETMLYLFCNHATS